MRQLFHHAWPILIAQLLSMAMMIADTLIAGRYGTLDLAGVAIGSSFYISVVMLLGGMTFSLMLFALIHMQGLHARRMEETARALERGHDELRAASKYARSLLEASLDPLSGDGGRALFRHGPPHRRIRRGETRQIDRGSGGCRSRHRLSQRGRFFGRPAEAEACRRIARSRGCGKLRRGIGRGDRCRG